MYWRRVGVTKLLLGLAEGKDQKSTPKILEEVSETFSCLTCEGTRGSIGISLPAMVSFSATHLHDNPIFRADSHMI